MSGQFVEYSPSQALAIRDEQVFQKTLERDEEDKRERIFAALWQEEYVKKLRREKDDQDRAAKHKEDTKSALEEQVRHPLE